MNNYENVKKLFIARVCLWIISLAATIYWIVWSFKLYIDNGYFMDVHEYATLLRPKFYGGVIVAVVCLFIATRLRGISDKIKKNIREQM